MQTCLQFRNKLGDSSSKEEEISKEFELIIKDNRQESEHIILLILDCIFNFIFWLNFTIKLNMARALRLLSKKLIVTTFLWLLKKSTKIETYSHTTISSSISSCSISLD